MVMSAARDYESLHDFVDRLTPAQVRRLRALVTQDEELAPLVDNAGPGSEPSLESGPPDSMLALFGSITDGPADIAERHDDYVRDRMRRRFGESV